MSILKQKSLKQAISLSGVGLHSGEKVNIKLIPQSPNTGIYFKRTDLNKNNLQYSLASANSTTVVQIPRYLMESLILSGLVISIIIKLFAENSFAILEYIKAEVCIMDVIIITLSNLIEPFVFK